MSKIALDLETEKLQKLVDAAKVLRYEGKIALDGKEIAQHLNGLQTSLEEIIKDVTSRYAQNIKTHKFDMVTSLKEKKNK